MRSPVGAVGPVVAPGAAVVVGATGTMVVVAPGALAGADWLPGVVAAVALGFVVLDTTVPEPLPAAVGAVISPVDATTWPPEALVAAWSVPPLAAEAHAGGLAAMAATAPKNNEPLNPPARARDAAAACRRRPGRSCIHSGQDPAPGPAAGRLEALAFTGAGPAGPGVGNTATAIGSAAGIDADSATGAGTASGATGAATAATGAAAAMGAATGGAGPGWPVPWAGATPGPVARRVSVSSVDVSNRSGSTRPVATTVRGGAGNRGGAGTASATGIHEATASAGGDHDTRSRTGSAAGIGLAAGAVRLRVGSGGAQGRDSGPTGAGIADGNNSRATGAAIADGTPVFGDCGILAGERPTRPPRRCNRARCSALRSRLTSELMVAVGLAVIEALTCSPTGR